MWQDKHTYTVLGVMSGTSLDAIDLALCSFSYTHTWSFEILDTACIAYRAEDKQQLADVYTSDAATLVCRHAMEGKSLGNHCRLFLDKQPVLPGLISLHGPTLFHRPDLGYTFQLGHGGAVAVATGIPVVCDLRSNDIFLGGQGAPLVPLGDQLLFPEYDACLNLGGFSNISLDHNGKRIAWDICPVNFLLNRVARKAGMDMDKDGLLSKQGKILPDLLEKWNHLTYYARQGPKSLGREWVEEHFTADIEDKYSTEDLAATIIAHTATQIAASIRAYPVKRVLVTGGGAFHPFLIKQIRESVDAEIIIPHHTIVEYKEAIIFAFLGLLRSLEKENVSASVTGASRNSVSGAIYLP